MQQDDVRTGTVRLKTGLAEMLKGGVIMDVTNDEQARIAQEAGAVAVMALERVPADIRKDGGVARMSDPEMIEISFLGGASSIGASCTLVRVAGVTFVVDCGVRYSGSRPLPDLSLLHHTRVDAILLTHAHMDHTGGSRCSPKRARVRRSSPRPPQSTWWASCCATPCG